MSSNGSSPETSPERGTTILVRRGRTPTLGLWVTLALVVGAIAGAATALAAGVNDLSTTLYFAATGVFFVGLPLGAIAGIIDGILASRRERALRRARSAAASAGTSEPSAPERR